MVPANTGCACLGSVLTFTCSITGGVSTLWNGTAFDCIGNGDSISLRHRLFGSGGIAGVCNNGAITGQSTGVDNECYTSQLNVTVDPSMSNKTVVCSQSGTTITGNATITILKGWKI